jgi:hypothetical protein
LRAYFLKQQGNKTKGKQNNGHLSILIMNGNGLNAPIKTHRIANWIKKQTQPYAAYKKLT